MSEALDTILDDLASHREKLQDIRQVLLANAVMAGEIPSPSFEEERRIRFLLDRFTECGCQNISTDEASNGVAIWPGRKGKNNILVLAHADTPFASSVDHAVTVHPDHLEGPGIGDNSVGLAAVASLPIVLEKLGVELDDNLILLGSTRSLGHGDLGGLRFFLEHNNLPIRAAVVVEGVYLGRLSYASLGMLRGEITCRVPKGYDWTRFNAAGAISALSRVINALQEIPMAKEPPADLILGSVGGGTAFNTIARKASLRFEVRAEVAGVITSVLEQIEEIVEEVAQRHAIDVNLQVVARRKSGGLAYRHPLVRAARRIMKTLEVEPRIAPSVGELAALINADIPSLTLGLTESENYHDYNEAIRIEPLYTGLTQLIGVLRAVDMGAGEEAPPKKKTAKKKSAEASTS